MTDKITLPRAIVRQALEALRKGLYTGKKELFEIALNTLSAALAEPQEPVGNSYADLFNALQRIETAAVFLPSFKITHEGGLEAVVQNIVDAIAALAEPDIDPVYEYRKGFIAGQIDMRDRPEEQPEPVAQAEPDRWVIEKVGGKLLLNGAEIGPGTIEIRLDGLTYRASEKVEVEQPEQEPVLRPTPKFYTCQETHPMDDGCRINREQQAKQESVLPRWVAVFEDEAKKPLSVIGLKRDDIKQAVRDYKLMQDLYESVANMRDAAVRFLAEAQGQKTSETFDLLSLDKVSRCIDHHAGELFRLRTKVQQLEFLLEQQTEPEQQAVSWCMKANGCETKCGNCPNLDTAPAAQPTYPLPDDLYESKDWQAGNYAQRVEWLHGMYESKKQELEAYLEVELTASTILNLMPSSIPAEHDGALMEFARDIEAKLKGNT